MAHRRFIRGLLALIAAWEDVAVTKLNGSPSGFNRS